MALPATDGLTPSSPHAMWLHCAGHSYTPNKRFKPAPQTTDIQRVVKTGGFTIQNEPFHHAKQPEQPRQTAHTGSAPSKQGIPIAANPLAKGSGAAAGGIEVPAENGSAKGRMP